VNIAHCLTQQATERPDAVAIIEKGGKITFGQLASRAARAADDLRNDGIKPGNHVLILTPMSIDLYTALIAVFDIGAIATFLDPSAGIDHINHCCEIAKPVALIGPRKVQLLRYVATGLRRIPRRYTVGGWFPFTQRWSEACGPAESTFVPGSVGHRSEDADPALVTFTSGSTGRPKAAVRSHGFLRAQHQALAPAIDLVPGEVDLATLPIFTLANLASGVTTLIPDADLRKVGHVDPMPIRRQIDQHRATRATASPAFLKKLIEGGVTLPNFQKVYTGGAPILPGFLDELTRALPSANIVAVYGSTEAEPIAHVGRAEMTPGDIAAMYAGRGLLAGHVVDAIQLRIIQADPGKPISAMTCAEFDAITTPHQSGEIVVTGDHVLKGYLGGIGDEQTKFKVDGQIWHRTGDAGYLDAEGRLWLLGRAEARIADAKGTVYPFAVECAASAVPGVACSALIAHRGQRYLIVQGRPDEQALRLKLAWAKLDVIRRVPRIPLDKRHNAKVDYPALRQLLD
jgi:acyl-CoA synthetase (AMP-forming)/AMP-acid ligase II